jgi:hypothetical protein
MSMLNNKINRGPILFRGLLAAGHAQQSNGDSLRPSKRYDTLTKLLLVMNDRI